MTHTTQLLETPADAAGVLRALSSGLRVEDQVGRERLQLALQWAAIHATDDRDEAAAGWHSGPSWCPGPGVMIAGEGAPMVAEHSVAEFATVLRLSSEAGRRLLGDAVELAHRLPRLWAEVLAGRCRAWKARLVAVETIDLSPEAAAHVDSQVHAFADRLGPAALDRLVVEARSRFMPDEAQRRLDESWDRRQVTVHDSQISFDGTIHVEADLELGDAWDLETAVAAGADQLRRLGSADSLDGRRASAVGDMARSQLALLFPESAVAGDAGPPPPESAGGDPRPEPARRLRKRLTLYVHLHESALTGTGEARDRLDVARWESWGNKLLLAEQVRAWCGREDMQVVVKPVIDLAEHVRVDAYEVPERLRERVALRDGSCVFPWCGRPARTLAPDQHDCDCDHIRPWRDDGGGGPTCSCNLAALCRCHHRAKTHAGWRYEALVPGTYLWTSPHGYRYLRDHTGTTPAGQRHSTPIGADPPERR